MYEIGGLWVWANPTQSQIFLGNRAAADAARSDTPVAKAPPLQCPPPTPLRRYGIYALPGEPAFALDIHASVIPDIMTRMLRGLETTQPPEGVVQISKISEGTAEQEALWGLWYNGILEKQGHIFGTKSDGPILGVMQELIHKLLRNQSILCILHGSGVLWRGKRLLFAGTSGSGKSTLAAQLVADGGHYLGDDLLPILEDGRIWPVPLSPTIKQGAWPLTEPLFGPLQDAPVFHKGDLPYKILEGTPYATGPGPVDLIVFPRFSPDLPPKAVQLSQIETLLNIAQAGIWMQPEHIGGFVTLLDQTPAFAMRSTPDLAATQKLLQEALEI